MRLRVLWMLLGAVLVVATFTFPMWQPIVDNRPVAPDEAFPGLDLQLQDDFQNLPQEQQRAYLAFQEQDAQKALAMVSAALLPRTELPEEDSAMPELTSPVTVASGTFQQISPIRGAQGTVNIYRDAANVLTMRFEGFSMVNGPNLRVILSATEAPGESADLTANGIDPIDAGALLATNGGQNYTLPSLDLTEYRSVVIMSETLDLIYTYAPLFVRQ